MGSDPVAPAPTESTRQMLDAYAAYLPILQGVNAQNLSPLANAQLKVSQDTSPAYAKLQQQLYDDYGPLMADTANRIQSSQQKAQAQSDLDTLMGPGKQLISEAQKQQEQINPEYYKTREQMGGRLGDLLGSIDLSGKLSGGETEELSRAQARENSNRGIASAPSQTAAIQNALTFGNARTERQDKAKGQLGAALGVGNQFLPASQSGQDAFQIGAGRSSMPNAGDSKFQGVDKSGADNAIGQQNQLLGITSGFQNKQMDINANRRDQLDRFNQTFSSIVGSL